MTVARRKPRRPYVPKETIGEGYDGGLSVNLTPRELDDLPADDEVDLDSLAELWAPLRRFPAFPSHRR